MCYKYIYCHKQTERIGTGYARSHAATDRDKNCGRDFHADMKMCKRIGDLNSSYIEAISN
jgi:hypothetical protein